MVLRKTVSDMEDVNKEVFERLTRIETTLDKHAEQVTDDFGDVSKRLERLEKRQGQDDRRNSMLVGGMITLTTIGGVAGALVASVPSWLSHFGKP